MSGYNFDRDYLPRILSGSRSGLTESTRPKTSVTFIDEGKQDARDIWSDSAIDRYGKGSHSKHHYSKKRRPISADSSASSVSSISEFNEEASEDSFKLDLSELLDSKKETSGYRPYRSNHEGIAVNTWPHPPKYIQHDDILKKSTDLARSLPMDVSKLDLNDKDLLDSHRKKISSLGQERDTLSMQASHYRQSAENAASDLAAEKVKNQTLAEEIKKGRAKMSDMQQKIMDLKCEIESGKQLQARTSAMLSSLQHRVKDAEDFAADKENKMSRVDVTISSLKKELQRQIDERQKVEFSLKHHLSVEEENSKRAAEWERKLREMCALLANVLGIDAPGSLEASDLIISRVKEAVRDYDSLQKQMHSVTHQFQNSDLEVKASRETIMRLVADLGKEQKVAGERLKEIEELTRERDIAKQKVREAEIEVQQVKDNLKHSQDAWNETRERLTEQDIKLHKYDKALHSKEESYHKADIKLKHFKRQLSELLSTVDDSIGEKEEDILHRVRKMHQSYKEKKSSQDKLKSRVSALAEELTNQRNLQHTAVSRANEAEIKRENMIERVKALEGELIAADVERDRLKDDRNRFVAFVDKLSRAMKLDEVAVEGGFDINSDAILLRAEQLSKSETNSLQDRTSTIYSLQRKSKTLKQQLESRDFQLSLSKKKMSELEEILKDRSRIENERDDTTIKHQKLHKKCERLQDELNRHKDIVTQLKAKIMDYGEQQIKIEEQKRVIEDLESVVNRLAKSKHKTDRQLAEKREAFKSTSKEKEIELTKTSSNYQLLEKELQLTREALEEAQNRERQLVNFRQALAKLIGLEVEDLSVPDYEIISRLEKIVRGYSSYTDTVKTLENTLSTMEKDFRHGYTGVKSILHSP